MKIPFLSVLLVAYSSLVEGKHVINQNSGDLKVDSPMGQLLMKHARALNNNNQQDVSFLSGYSVKFQGCHHVQQWNEAANEESDVRIKTKRLVRFRLCPQSDCQADTSGCTSKYGDYVVDMNTFVTAYLTAKEQNGAQMCEDADATCSNTCGGDENCVTSCYSSYGMSWCLSNRRLQQNNFNPLTYSACAQFNTQDGNYYLGPYCADQGGEIHLGLFTDDTCTSFASGGESSFYNAMGFALPYSSESLVSQLCLACGSTNDNGASEVNEMCSGVYYVSGKCETRMSIDYPNESSCSYIEGIKIIREDGVIRTASSKKSKAAAVCIGMFLTIAVLLAGYVYYLRTSKLSHSRIFHFFLCVPIYGPASLTRFF
jgi:hypothetical protein